VSGQIRTRAKTDTDADGRWDQIHPVFSKRYPGKSQAHLRSRFERLLSLQRKGKLRSDRGWFIMD
jgi:hypothetical protein